MNIPSQSAPIARGHTGASAPDGVQPSDIACSLCLAGCNLLSGIAKQICVAGCNATVC